MVISAANIFAFIFFILMLCDFNPASLFSLVLDTGLLINLGLPTICVVFPTANLQSIINQLVIDF